ncbi:glycosyl hydrolase family 95 catalytic domain-containing protein [Winogradskyella sp. Asnod2-B02-A]|uniref:glycosyl hydrolase family 95 catalytic domain-containing protein n=1 Tax=Winogradskyella sp. Asnod2-B02-A TaxID=3160583 RepID=UPI0038655393
MFRLKLEIRILYLFILVSSTLFSQNNQVDFKVDYESFLSKHDLLWDLVPDKWQTAPYSGNGNVGFLLYQSPEENDNVISLHIGRHDYYDHREAETKADEMLWIKRSRLPLGHFKLKSKGKITGIDMRLDLWNAELIGTITTTKGSYNIKGLTHSTTDIIYFETETKDEDVEITWHAEDPIPPVYEVLKSGGGPKGGTWDKMRAVTLEMAPKPTFSEKNGYKFCYQPLYDNRGETTTGYKITGNPSGKQQLIASVHHCFPDHNSLEIVTENLETAEALIQKDNFVSTHQKWWHDYYPLSFLTINDAEKESFYWIQMYKLGSASRGNGPILDLMGPWYNRTFWPMVWGDLNVQLIYWTHLTANRMSIGESLPNNIDKYAENLENNVPGSWKNSAAVAALMPQDLIAFNGAKVPDMLAWMLNDYWLHCQFAGDDIRMRDNLFPILKKTVNSYLNYIKDNPVEAEDGKIHIKYSWSPEYKPGRGQDINFTLALIRWSCQTLIDIDEKHELNDPLKKEWKHLLDNLVDFQIDKNGLMVGKDRPFANPHRHYSHLLAFYPLMVITPEKEEDKKLLRTSLDHWLDVTFNSGKKIKAMPVTGYTATGASSMYANLGDAEKAYYYLDFLIKHKNISSTTMYSEGKINPVIESPLSFATSLHDMMLQSWGGKIRVFPASPRKWKDVAFHDLRTQGAFLVSAKKVEGVTEFVSIKSLKGNACVVHVDFENPKFYIDGKSVSINQSEDGSYKIDLKQNESVIVTSKEINKTDLSIKELPKSEAEQNLFGYGEKTKRLPGHKYYSSY